jgi:hypothetical protein
MKDDCCQTVVIMDKTYKSKPVDMSVNPVIQGPLIPLNIALRGTPHPGYVGLGGFSHLHGALGLGERYKPVGCGSP